MAGEASLIKVSERNQSLLHWQPQHFPPWAEQRAREPQ